MNNHITVGIYPSENFKVNVVRDEDLEKHIEYNLIFRPGRAFFVDGTCKYRAWMSAEDVKKWEDKIRSLDININRPSDKYI